MKLLLWIIFGVPISAGLYVGYVYLEAWFETKALPRSEVFVCDKHGPMQRESTISFMDLPYCSICFHERMKSAESMLGNGQRIER
jgi:hypothetical protein